MESILVKEMMSADLTIDRRVPRGAIPGGEAGVVHRGGGRYASLIGSNALFHNPSDHGAGAVDPNVIGRFVSVLTALAKSLTWA